MIVIAVSSVSQALGYCAEGYEFNDSLNKLPPLNKALSPQLLGCILPQL